MHPAWPGRPFFTVVDLHDGLLDGTGQWGIFAAFRLENLLFDDRVQLLGTVVLLFVPRPMMFLMELFCRIVHGLIRDAGLCGMGFAVALILADDGLYFPLFGAGELYRRLVSLLFGQSHLPPFPFGAAA